MIRKIQEGGIGSWRSRYGLGIFYGARDPIPSFAVMQIVGSTIVGSTTTYYVSQPSGAQSAKYLINVPEPTPAIGYGAATDSYPAPCAIIGSPNVNQEIGPVAGSWAMTINGKGYIYVGGLNNGVGRVAAKGNSDFPLVMIQNNSGIDKPNGSISGLVNLLTPPPNMPLIPTFGFTTPSATQPFAILVQALKVGEVGYAAPVGVVATSISFTDASHTKADCIGGDFLKLASGTDGPATILWRAFQGISGQSSLGIQNAVVLLDRSSSSTQDIRAVTVDASTAGTGYAGGPVSPGVGTARLYTPPASNQIAGTAWQPTNQIVIYETWAQAAVAKNKSILLRIGRTNPTDGTPIYVDVTEPCKALPDSPGGGP